MSRVKFGKHIWTNEAMSHFRVPWNQNNANGYVLIIIVSIFMSTAYTFCNSMFLSFFAFICLYFRAFQHQFEDKIEQLYHDFFEEGNKTMALKIAIAKQRFNDAVAFHVHYKRFGH